MEAKVYHAEDLHTGLRVSYDRFISEDDVLSFARLTGDENPLHVDSEYARASNYRDRIVHGVFQVSLASALLGMHLPGRNVVLSSINSRFPAPLYYPARVRISGEISAWNFATLGGQLKVVVAEADTTVPTAEIVLGFTLHERSRSTTINESIEQTVVSGSTENRGMVIVTGAAGGLGTALVESLANHFSVLALVKEKSLPDQLRRLPRVCEINADLATLEIETRLSEIVSQKPVFGIVHAAWPGAPRGSLLQASSDVIKAQVDFGTNVTVRLARFLFDHAGKDGGRMIALGSTAGSLKPYLPLGVYSLGKACLENTVRLLAPELARRKITINAVCPSFTSVGINQAADERKRLQEAATVPMGRLCQPTDVVGMVNYLLSPVAAFVSGQTIALNGAQL